MLPTFVIGLREGLEAALIVGIVAAFLGKQGRRDALRQVWLGVIAAVVLCVGIAVVLKVVAADLPQRGQEGLETVVGALAVGMVTVMILWMRKHARGMKKELEGAAASALATGSARALVVMAFLAVLREGFETAVFVLAVLQQPSSHGALPSIGVFLGLLVAVAIGWGIYRGGVKINLAKFFKATGVVLVVVAAGLVMSALHTANEANWLNVGQAQALDLSWLVRPGTPLASLFTGVLGLRPSVAVIELIGWLGYLVVVGAFVVAPPRSKRVMAKAVEPAAAGQLLVNPVQGQL
ncbi:MAG: iron uptake transporter permease EfeU [Acidothermaceae bacterium]